MSMSWWNLVLKETLQKRRMLRVWRFFVHSKLVGLNVSQHVGRGFELTNALVQVLFGFVAHEID